MICTRDLFSPLSEVAGGKSSHPRFPTPRILSARCFAMHHNLSSFCPNLVFLTMYVDQVSLRIYRAIPKIAIFVLYTAADTGKVFIWIVLRPSSIVTDLVLCHHNHCDRHESFFPCFLGIRLQFSSKHCEVVLSSGFSSASFARLMPASSRNWPKMNLRRPCGKSHDLEFSRMRYLFSKNFLVLLSDVSQPTATHPVPHGSSYRLSITTL